MSSSSSVRSALCGRSVAVPLIGCPDCGQKVRFYRSSTDEHDGWIFYKCVNHTVTCDFWRWELEYVEHLVQIRRLVGDAAVDAIDAAEDRREELERQRTESMAGKGTAGRGMVGRGMAGRGTIGRANYASSSENKYATKQQIAMLLGLGGEILHHHHQIPLFFLICHLQFRAPPDPFSPLFNTTNRSPSHIHPAVTMVSWDDLPSSSEDDSMTSKPPATIFCEEWSGLAIDLPSFRCGHGSLCEKHVAFESVDSVRRFLACAQKVLDEKKKMENELRHFKLDFAKMVAEKEQAMSQLGSTQLALTDLRVKAEKERDQVVQERDQVIQERDDLKHEKRKLEYMIGDLFKHKEAIGEKIMKLKAMLNEFD
ncbi:uncharacterized protein LOC119279773 [Triticum dicoccoides]|uniref:uncharacterized protein LOC119279773 n=1 Tax=Triticum dicoccoides TaxID=85692 RepID=UPI00188E4632|nr:uncharacterized protein LOC119279773 [Triticum dicoccoides]